MSLTLAESGIGANPAEFKTIIMNEKRYKPIVSATMRCIPTMQLNQILRVILGQMKTGYPISKRQMPMPKSGKRYADEATTFGETKLKGGEVKICHIAVPFHHSAPVHLAIPLKK